jgi:hypothetical protein
MNTTSCVAKAFGNTCHVAVTAGAGMVAAVGICCTVN